MCGFVGGNVRNVDYAAAAEAIRHRGPDDQQVWSDDHITLAFRRLSIIDLDSRSSQPMWHKTADVGLVFNGEIYGFQRLRAELESLGQVFRTRSDTEVVLNAYVEWGDAFVDRIDGMFAIAIYDRRNRTIRLWRDRVGIKPLYYFWDGKRFAFASEIKALAALLSDKLEPQLDAYYDFLTYHYVPAPKTSWKNIQQLRPAHCVTFDVDSSMLAPSRPYWTLLVEAPRKVEDPEVTAEELRATIARAVGEQCVADVPLGVFLSGGIDSSIVTWEASRHVAGVRTFSVGFDSEWNELPFARQMARHAETTHTERLFTHDEMDATQLRRWFDDPFADTSAFPTHAIACVARETVKVALAGDGGDELFGGYPRYLNYREHFGRCEALFDVWERAKGAMPHRSWPRRAMNLLALPLAPSLPSYVKQLAGLTRGEKWRLARAWGIPDDYDDYWAWREFWRPELPLRTRLQYLDFHRYLPDDLLTKVDRVSMAASLEVRVPFLARDVVELAFRIPESLRYRGGLKGVLRHAYRGRIPDDLLDRPKRGFSVPQAFLSAPSSYRPAQILQQSYGIELPRGFLPPAFQNGRRAG